MMRVEGSDWPPVVAIVGPTAVGKSRLALALADKFEGAIVSADSRQVYRYLDIGTDKPPPAERMAIPHYMLDLVEPSELYSAQRFQQEASRALQLLRPLGRTAFVVGGTGFYIRALLDRESFPKVVPNPIRREQLHREAEVHGATWLHARLAELDPASAARIHPNNASRAIRAIEIVEETGAPVAPIQAGAPIPALYLGLQRDRPELIAIADQRVDAQVEAGLLEETRRVLSMGFAADAPGLQGFGYRDMIAHLEGILSLDQAIQQYKAATHAYIRRQLTWFHANPRIEWIPADDHAIERAIERVTTWLGSAV